jgi:ubiquinone/menaquinone biosynthesis C-methylase UbiE
MTSQLPRELSETEASVVEQAQFNADIGLKVIHPGGRRSTEQLITYAEFEAGHQVLDIGCGVGTTAIEIAKRFGCNVTAVDILPSMIERATMNIKAAGVGNRVKAEQGDILALQFDDNTFDRVIIEAVTLFVDRPKALKEVARVCRAGGYLVDHEAFFSKEPPPGLLEMVYASPVPNVPADGIDDWIKLYEAAGFTDIEYAAESMQAGPGAILRDEGLVNMVKVLGRALTRGRYRRRLMATISTMKALQPYIQLMVLRGTAKK